MTSATGVPVAVGARRLGKLPPKHDPRTLRMASYIDPKRFGRLPSAQSWTGRCSPEFGMMRNDELGDCTIAAIGHHIQVWTANQAREVTIPDDVIVKTYSAFTGYDPANPDSDQGGVMLDVLNRWRKDGVGGYRIDAYVALEPHNDLHLTAAIARFGGCYAGVSLPITAQSQKIWSVVPNTSDADVGSWGGHAIAMVAYDSHYYWFISWGKLMRMTRTFAHKYIDEAYAKLAPAWYGPKKKAPSGFDLAQLQADLAAL